MRKQVRVYWYDGIQARYHIDTIEIASGDKLILCVIDNMAYSYPLEYWSIEDLEELAAISWQKKYCKTERDLQAKRIMQIEVINDERLSS